MRNHITIVSRARFKEMVEHNQIPEDTAIISIHEPIGANKMELFGGASEKILEDAPNVLNLWFDDAEADIPLEQQLWKKFGVVNSASDEIHLFNEDMADAVLDFVEKNKDAKQWLLHCTAGISRSGAVGGFVADYLGISYLDYKKANPRICPNALVSKLLTKKLLQE